MATELPTHVSPAEAVEMLQRYPYFTLPALLVLKQSPVDSDADKLAARVAVSLSDMEALAQVAGLQASVFDNFYPSDQKSTPSTEDTIDTFLNTFGRQDMRETDALSKLIFSSTPDYAAVLAAEEKDNVPTEADLNDPSLSEQDKLINSFILGNRNTPAQGHTACVSETESKHVEIEECDKQNNLSLSANAAKETVKDPESASLTESFVRILIKNRNYSKAIEIISGLSLKNPEKSIYFADQIRFLQKLIINENKK